MKKKKLPTLLLALCLLGAPLAACADNPPELNLPDESVNGSASAEETTPPTSEQPSTPASPTSPAEPEPSEPVVTPSPEVTVPKAQYAKCTGTNVNLRAGAGTDFAVVGSAEKGTTYAITGKTGSWYKTYYRGKTAYISASYVSVFALEKTENNVEKVIDEGYKLLGVPYVYGAVRLHDGNGRLLGGFNVQKFDCSSLVQYIFYKGTGTLLGVHTRAQVQQGKYVKPSDLQRGDCIFFTNEDRKNNTGLEKIGHVALYLGDGYILHTASDYARIEKMSAKRWSFYIEARRFV